MGRWQIPEFCVARLFVSLSVLLDSETCWIGCWRSLQPMKPLLVTSCTRSGKRSAVTSRGWRRLFAETFARGEGFNMANVFQHCGWAIQGHFDPSRRLTKETRRPPYVVIEGESQSSDGEENLGFFVRQMHETD